jgi:hypothetical protein
MIENIKRRTSERAVERTVRADDLRNELIELSDQVVALGAELARIDREIRRRVAYPSR